MLRAGAPAYFARAGAGVCSAPAKLWQHLTASYWLDRSFLFIHAYTVSRRCLMGNDRYVFSSQQSPYICLLLAELSFYYANTEKKPDEVRHDSLWTILMTLKGLPLSRTLNRRHIIWRSVKIKNKDSACALKCEIAVKFQLNFEISWIPRMPELEIFCRSRSFFGWSRSRRWKKPEFAQH